MQVSEAMTSEVRGVSPEQTIREAAGLMAAIDAGVLPVSDGNRLVGMVTDRDIAVRAVAAGKNAETPVREVMTAEVKFCFEDADIDEVCRNMANDRVRRLVVVNHDRELVGILSLGDVALKDAARSGAAIQGVSRPGGPHSQGAAGA